MTKRFQIIGENYTNIDMPVFVVCREDDCCFEVYEDKEDTQIVCDKLNKLVEENELLKQQNADWETSFDKCKYEKHNLTEENEELKKKLSAEKPILDYFHNRHYYIRDMTTEEIKEWNKTISKVMCE